MTDFFREVDEELRNERMRSLWQKYRFFIIGVIVFIIGATAAYRYYIHYVEIEAGKSGDEYLKAIELSENGKHDEARKILAILEKDGFGAYPELAKLRSAGILVAENKKEEALKVYDNLVADSALTETLKGFVRLQSVRLAIDLESFDNVIKRSAPLMEEGNPWRNLTQEARILSAWKAGKQDEAAKWVKQLKDEEQLSQGLRQRVLLLEELIIAKGGTLPQDG